ncbi:hypothetical protein [Lutispora sp.]|uniref:hypothetical protein n=1 Tax=Lutispora sp. TaxID=2828727 RepID=UPI002B1F819E|nr:hypothetical protein [Lutispora sp.]MEA4960158.1 hypothetical protein [Lutispora sp.]
MKKKSIVVSILVIALLFLTGITCLATTYYVSTGTQSLDVYGYGCDFSGTAGAEIASNGAWPDVTGVKVRIIVYKNGLKDVDTSATDTTSPYSVTKTGSCSSSTYSNVWKLTTTHYVKCGAESYYTASGGFEETQSN